MRLSTFPLAAFSLAALSIVIIGCGQTPAPGVTNDSVSKPVVRLAYQVADDLRSVTGTESIEFTPNHQMCEVVLRAWPNKPMLTRAGNAMTVEKVILNGSSLPFQVESSGALPEAPGTLVEAKFPSCQASGSPLQIQTEFTITLGADTDERMGYSSVGTLAWFQTAFPLLAWQNGVGWVRDAAVDLYGETVTNEVFELDDLAITAPTQFSVAGVGARGETTIDGSRTTHHFEAPQMRDVSVMVGSFTTTEFSASDVSVHLSVPPFARLSDETEWKDQVAESLDDLVEYLGPMPYPDLWVNVIPSLHEGVESSGSVQLGGADRWVRGWLVTHELAHQWIYALVGNNEALHPWLDESVTSMIQAVVDDPEQSPEPSRDFSPLAADQIGKPMSFFEDFARPGWAYNEAIYTAGSAVLIQARDDGGHDAFDEALIDYIDANADRVARPQDFADAFADVPGVIRILQKHSMIN